MSERDNELREERSKINSCLNSYHRDHKGFPTLAVVNRKVYDFLKRNNLLNEPSNISSVNNQTTLTNDLGVIVEVYKADDLSQGEKSLLEKNTENIELPLNLGTGNPSKIIKTKYRDTFNLSASSNSLAFV